jgi:hypothetical protein
MTAVSGPVGAASPRPPEHVKHGALLKQWAWDGDGW